MLKDALDSDVDDARGRVRKLHLNWGHASAYQLRRILAAGGSVSKAVLDAANDAVNHCEIHPASEEAPHSFIAGADLESAFSQEVQIYAPLLDLMPSSRYMPWPSTPKIIA